ncbi:MAG: hypothetical protein ACRCTE_00755 [Cellulosilyticaceae bacterium]
MKSMKKVVLVLLSILLMSSFAGCGSSKTLDRGTLTDHVYTNDYFGLEITYPEAWTMSTNEEIDQMIEQSNQMLGEMSPNSKAGLKLAELKTVYFSIGGNNDPMNIANFMSLAEKLSALQGISTSTDYLNFTKKSLETVAAQMPYKFPKEVYTETVAGQEFGVLEAQLDNGSAVLTQKYYCRIIDGYALCFIATSMDDANAALNQGILDSIVLK